MIREQAIMILLIFKHNVINSLLKSLLYSLLLLTKSIFHNFCEMFHI